MATFHLVPRGISKCISKMDYRAHCKISKMSKNSPRSFLSRENRRREVGIFSLLFKPFSHKIKLQIKPMLVIYCFTGPKIVINSIIKWKLSWQRLYLCFWSFVQKIFPFWAKSSQCHFHKEKLLQLCQSWALNLFPWCKQCAQVSSKLYKFISALKKARTSM